MLHKKWNSNFIKNTTLVATTISLVAALFSAYDTRKHNVLSSNPILRITSQLDSEENKVGLFIENYGEGAATIKEITVFVDGKKFEHFEENGWLPIIKATNLDTTGLKAGAIKRGAVISKDARNWYFLKPKLNSKCGLEQITMLLTYHDLKFKVDYLTPYNQELSATFDASTDKQLKDVTIHLLEKRWDTVQKKINELGINQKITELGLPKIDTPEKFMNLGRIMQATGVSKACDKEFEEALVQKNDIK